MNSRTTNKVGVVNISEPIPRNRARLEIRVDESGRCFIGMNIVETGNTCTVSAWVQPERMRTELGWETDQMDWAVAEAIVTAGVIKFYETHGWRIISHHTGKRDTIVFTFRRVRSRAKK